MLLIWGKPTKTILFHLHFCIRTISGVSMGQNNLIKLFIPVTKLLKEMLSFAVSYHLRLRRFKHKPRCLNECPNHYATGQKGTAASQSQMLHFFWFVLNTDFDTDQKNGGSLEDQPLRKEIKLLSTLGNV